MNSAPINQEKRSIKVKDFLADLRSGMDDGALLTKYYLTPVGLEKFYGMLLERGILDPDEMNARKIPEIVTGSESATSDAEDSSFICPACLAAHDTMFDICPCCGVSFQELLNTRGKSKPAAAEQEDYFTQKEEQEDTRGDLFVVPSKSSGQGWPDVRTPSGDHPEAAVKEEVEFSRPFDWHKDASQFDDSLDDIVCGMPLDEYSPDEGKPTEQDGVSCENCQGVAVPALRDIYDRKRSLLSLTLCGASLFLGLVGAIVLSFFEGYSLARLLVVYVTGLFLLFGGVLCGVGSFMYLAREKVYFCPSCKRLYPRG
jgi:hypothetical protein